MLRAVIFDLDGTLYDNRCLQWMVPMQEFFRMKMRFLTRERSLRKSMRGRPHATEEDFYQHFFKSISSCHPERVEKWYHRHYLPLQVGLIRHYCKVDQWVKPRLEDLRRQGIKVALYSDYGCAVEKLQALGVDPALFDLIIDAPSLGGLKPCRQSTERLLRMLDVKPDEVLFVGDRVETDIESARGVGAAYELLQRHDGKVTFTKQII